MSEAADQTTPAAKHLSKDGKALEVGSRCSLPCEVIETLSGDFVEVRFPGGAFMVRACELVGPSE